MAITATSLGTPANNFLGSSVSLTCASACAIGDTVVVVTSDLSTGSTVGTLADSKGNAYTKQAQKNPGANTGNILCAIWTSVLTVALTTSDTITYTFHVASTGGSIDALKVAGATSSPLDLVVTPTTGASQTPSITSGIPAQAGELFIGVVIFNTGADTGTQASGWVAPPAAQTGTSSTPCIIGGNQLNAGTGTLTYNPTVGTSRAWAAFMISLKAVVNATLTCAFGSFAETGEVTTFATRTPCAVGSFTETGEAATFATKVSLGFATYALTGKPATFTASSATVATLAFGSFALTGEPSTFGVGLACSFGSFALTGEAVTFGTTHSAALDTGFYVLTGEVATFVGIYPWTNVLAPTPSWTPKSPPSPDWVNIAPPSSNWVTG